MVRNLGLGISQESKLGKSRKGIHPRAQKQDKKPNLSLN